MARVFADLITNQPTNQPLLSIKQTTEGSCSSCEAFLPLEALFIKSPEHKEESEWTVCASYELSSEHIRIIGGWQIFALGVIEQIVSICRL